MLAEILVAVVIDGRLVQASRPALVRADVVVAPLDPFVRRIAERVMESDDGRTVLTRGDRSLSVTCGSRVARADEDFKTLPIAPFVRGGELFIPLAAVAQALGASVSYDGRAHTLSIQTQGLPLATMTPFAGPTPTGPFVTFAPTSTPAPRVTVTGIPKPRRTPILVEPPEGS